MALSKHPLLSTTQIQSETGWSKSKIYNLIRSGRLVAINSSPGGHPYYEITRESFEAIRVPVAVPKKCKPSQGAKR